MAPSGTDQGLPGLRPASSRKRKETARFLENAEPPLLKKKRVNKRALATHVSTHKSTEDTGSNEDDAGAVNRTHDSDNDMADEDSDKADEDEDMVHKDDNRAAQDDKAEESDEDDVEEVRVEESADSERSKHLAGRNHCH
jgi:hypothetical protein